MRQRILTVATALIAVASMPNLASAQFTVFTDKSSFLAALSNPATDDFSALGTGEIGSPLFRTVGPYSYRASATNSSDFFGGLSGTPNQILSAQNEAASLFFDNFSSNVRAFGGNFFGAGQNGALTNMTLNITATNAGGTATQQLINPGFNTFLGFIATQTFTSVAVTRASGAFTSADNIVLGGPPSTTTTTPEPSTFVLLSAGIAIVGFGTRRRRAE